MKHTNKFGIFFPVLLLCYCLLLPSCYKSDSAQSPEHIDLFEKYASPSIQALPAATEYTFDNCVIDLNLDTSDHSTDYSLKTYVRAERAYQKLMFTEAIQMARLSFSLASSGSGQNNQNILHASTQLLTILHFDAGLHLDSILYYEALSSELTPAISSKIILARQQLCRAFGEMYTYDWQGIGTAANYGLSLLDEEQYKHTELYGRLLLMAAWSDKKYGDQLETPSRQEVYWESSLNSAHQSRQTFISSGSLRWREAQKEMAVIACRFKDSSLVSHFISPLHFPESEEKVARYGFPDRLWGYYFNKIGNHSRAKHYYTRFLRQPPGYDFFPIGEAHYMLLQSALDEEDSDAELHWNIQHYNALPCRSGEVSEDALRSRLLPVPTSVYCQYGLASTATALLNRFKKTANPQDLETAHYYLQGILQYWSGSFQQAEDGSVLAQIQSIGKRVLDSSVEAAYLTLKNSPNNDNAQTYFRTMETGKTLLLKRQIASYSETGKSPLLDSLKRMQATIHLLRLKERTREDFTPTQQSRLLSLTKLYEVLSQKLNYYTPSTSTGKSKTPLTLTEIRAGLSPTEYVLEFTDSPFTYYGIFLSQDTLIGFSVTKDSLITQSIRNFKVAVAQTTPGTKTIENYRTSGATLFRRFLAPFYSCMGDSAKLLIIPDGALSNLSFAALPTSKEWEITEDIPYLLYDAQVRYSPSMEVDLVNAKRRTILPSTLLTGSWTHPDLAPTMQVINHGLRASYPNSVLHSRAIVDKERFKRSLAEFEIIHLSMHAQGDPENLFNNFIQVGQGINLNGLEIGQLRLRAKLVFLAACETGLGKAQAGEGTFSITRSFHQAGVPDVVGALWKVPAASTAAIADKFYTYLPGSGNAAIALQKAKEDCAFGRFKKRWRWAGYWAGLVAG